MPTNATFKQREYEKLEALAKIAYDEYLNGYDQIWSSAAVKSWATWDEMNDASKSVWIGIVQAVRVGVLRGVA